MRRRFKKKSESSKGKPLSFLTTDILEVALIKFDLLEFISI
jgi:hypothetical protein